MSDAHTEPAEHDPTNEASTPRRARPVLARMVAAMTLAGCLAVLTVAVLLVPDESGMGTHRQFGGGPCGMLVMTGLPCPTCGMTTAFAHFVRGQFLRSFAVQPAGFVLAGGTVGLGVVAGVALIRGRWPNPAGWILTPHRLFLALLGLLLGAWAFKIALGLADGSLPYGR